MKVSRIYSSLTFVLMFNVLLAQSPALYLRKVLKELNRVESKRRSYYKAASNEENAVRVEKTRTAALQASLKAISKLSRLSAFRNDASLRDSALSYLTLSYSCLNEDYVSAAEMEIISEKSFDAIESYVAARENAGRAVQVAANSLNAGVERFACRYAVELEKSPGSVQQLRLADSYRLYNSIYSIFFKCYKQESYLLQAMKEEDVSGVEQNRKALLHYSQEGLESLGQLTDNDIQLSGACKVLLEFYRNEASSDLAMAAEFYAGKENFLRLKNGIEWLEPDQMTTQRLELFCKTLSELGTRKQVLTQNLQVLEQRRKVLLDDWNISCAVFIGRNGE
jgi:hypothetical protein